MVRLRNIVAFALSLLALLSATAASAQANDPTADGAVIAIGDSITLGQGALGPGVDCPLDDRSNSLSASYASKVAEALGAEPEIFAWSGRGLVRNFQDAQAAPISALFKEPETRARLAGIKQARLVLIHVGTNDFYTADPRAAFETAYTDLLTDMSTRYPDATLVGMVGPMLSGDDFEHHRAAVVGAMSAFRERTGRNAILVDLSHLAKGAESFGCQWHPSAAQHQAMADAVLSAISR